MKVTTPIDTIIQGDCLEEIEKRDIRISELARAISLRDQLIATEEGER